MSSVFCILMLWHVGFCWSWRDCPSLPVPATCTGKQFTLEHAFQMQTTQFRAQALSSYLPSLIILELGTRKLETVPVYQSLLKLFKQILNLFVSPLQLTSSRNQNKSSCPLCPLPRSVSWLTLVSLMSSCPLLLWSGCITKYLFNGNDLQIYWVYHA